jgi:hypothetical protein
MVSSYAILISEKYAYYSYPSTIILDKDKDYFLFINYFLISILTKFLMDDFVAPYFLPSSISIKSVID